MIWCSVDPGGTTGYVVWESSEDWKEAWILEVGEFACGMTWMDCRRKLRAWLKDGAMLDWIEMWVFEDFLLRGVVKSTSREGLTPCMITGLLLGELPEAVDVVFYSVADAKGVITNDRAKRKVGPVWWKRIRAGGKEHKTDALRQGLLHIRKVGATFLQKDVLTDGDE